MNDKLINYKNKTTEFWQSRTKNQKGMLIGSVLLVLTLLLLFMWMGSRTSYVPLYSNLSVQETGEIKATLDSRGVANEVSSDGTTIMVPESMVDDLKVTLAAEGIPNSGRIDYSTFSDNMGFGTTDSEFQLLERAALQTSLEDLIRNIDGVQSSQVMLTMPEESIWLSDDPNEATASVLLNLQAGYTMDENQIRSMYHLVSRSVPNLPVENIVIMDQMSRYLELDDNSTTGGSSLSVYEQQRAIQRDIEKDIQRDLQQMLGTMMGPDKVLVSVTTDVDFTQENRQEELVEPVDEENMEGIAVSVERITETYEGTDLEDGGVVGTGETDIPGYQGIVGAGQGDYEKIEERINNDVNRISKEIVESPYQIRDIGIQVMVEPPDPEDPLSLSQQSVNDIQQILGQVVRTSINSDVTAEWEEDDINERIYVSAQEFFGKAEFEEPATGTPFWYYIVGALVAVVILLIFLLVRRNRTDDEEDMVVSEQTGYDMTPFDEGPETEEKARRKQLEQLAKDKPEEFSKLVRTWLSED
ncbi:flagellar M-ring protein FliF [Salipaludibacillus agaradhaerens]|uniref:flagellar basal-body MS-ring/collar protein FliF n=1 Tax=Salipaludibacillus agaradhaerens TaxID=76935 RepID=UPI0021511355|nr:flagellar basal-body MS-ring/collar protein FliF [Salipaludibacillus agaradhaerens]MCR6107073.1 flagellar M-ring protein FliF [Salipaludibacillus agaradhaerens]MCR6119104.1 flagellar M-ring protein FliF [Salipaludibacillus agaradhaerens]UJW58155.1 flagellar M-ring protein FliF [Bacillus sp. A116_S68]